jgi:hypothetical protein
VIFLRRRYRTRSSPSAAYTPEWVEVHVGVVPDRDASTKQKQTVDQHRVRRIAVARSELTLRRQDRPVENGVITQLRGGSARRSN